MNLNDDVVYRCLRLGPLRQLHARRSRSLVRHNDCLHGNCLLGSLLGNVQAFDIDAGRVVPRLPSAGDRTQ